MAKYMQQLQYIVHSLGFQQLVSNFWFHMHNLLRIGSVLSETWLENINGSLRRHPICNTIQSVLKKGWILINPEPADLRLSWRLYSCLIRCHVQNSSCCHHYYCMQTTSACYYIGQVAGESDSVAAVSTCSGFRYSSFVRLSLLQTTKTIKVQLHQQSDLARL